MKRRHKDVKDETYQKMSEYWNWQYAQECKRRRTAPRAPLTLYFSEVTGEIHGPMHFPADEEVEHIQEWLEEYTFRSRCKNEETYEWLAYAEISTSSGMVLDPCRNLDDYPVSDGDTLTVILVLADDLSELEAEEQAEERRLQALHAG